MPDSPLNIPLLDLRKQISSWLQTRLEKDSHEWITQKSKILWSGGEDWEFFSSFSKVPRFTGKKGLDLSEKEKHIVEDIRPGWKLNKWSIDQLGRAYIVLSIVNREKEEFLNLLEKIYQTSDMGEAEALFKSLAVLPYPNELQLWAAEGIRTNMTTVFNAVAHHNPYPSEYFDKDAWNQMVLKALFVETPLYPIQGIDKRANRELAEMLIDYAHERWAANRRISPELWRSVGPFAEGEILEDLKKAVNQQDKIQKQAAVLALSESPSANATELIQEHRDVKDEIEQNNITWDSIGQRFNKEI